MFKKHIFKKILLLRGKMQLSPFQCIIYEEIGVSCASFITGTITTSGFKSLPHHSKHS